jgi:hypothetical protein
MRRSGHLSANQVGKLLELREVEHLGEGPDLLAHDEVEIEDVK